MRAAAALFCARSAPSSTCRDGNRGGARRTTSNRSSGDNLAQGVKRFFITDDNFARNTDWEKHFRSPDRACAKRKSSTSSSSFRWTPCATGCRTSSRRPGARAWRACSSGWRASIPTSLLGRQEKAEQDRRISQDAAGVEEAGVTVFAGYILGFPSDTPESIMRDIKIIQRELPIDLAGVPLPDAAAGIGRSSEAAQGGAYLIPT